MWSVLIRNFMCFEEIWGKLDHPGSPSFYQISLQITFNPFNLLQQDIITRIFKISNRGTYYVHIICNILYFWQAANIKICTLYILVCSVKSGYFEITKDQHITKIEFILIHLIQYINHFSNVCSKL